MGAHNINSHWVLIYQRSDDSYIQARILKKEKERGREKGSQFISISSPLIWSTCLHVYMSQARVARVCLFFIDLSFFTWVGELVISNRGYI